MATPVKAQKENCGLVDGNRRLQKVEALEDLVHGKRREEFSLQNQDVAVRENVFWDGEVVNKTRFQNTSFGAVTLRCMEEISQGPLQTIPLLWEIPKQSGLEHREHFHCPYDERRNG